MDYYSVEVSVQVVVAIVGFLITHDYYNEVPQYKDTLYCKQLISNGH